MPKVSVIIATYRRGNELKKALDSLATQTYKDFEIVVIDDNACEDFNTTVVQIVNDFKEKNPGITVELLTNEENKGSAETRNIGIRRASGKYITFLDDDDIYLPEKIDVQATYMEKGDYDYSVTDLNLYDENDKLVRTRTREFIKDTSSDSLFQYHFKYHITGTDTMMFTKEYLEKIGGFPPIDVGDEFYLMHRAIEAGGKFGYLPVCHIKAYVHTNGMGLSAGGGKIDGENALYQLKTKYFDKMDSKAIRYIKMRHFAVLALAYLRNKNYVSFIKYAVKSVFQSPFGLLRIVIKKEY